MSIAPGIYDNLPADDYHADEAIGHSDCVTLMDECPAHWLYKSTHPESPKREFDIGTACHTMLLEPDQFADKFMVLPATYTDRKTGEVKPLRTYQTGLAQDLRDQARIQGMIPLLTHEYDEVADMSFSVQKNELAKMALSDGKAERSYFWLDKETGLMRKCRPDFVKIDQHGPPAVAVNFKTAISAHPDQISRAAWNNHWWSSQWYTIEGMKACGHPVTEYLYVVVEKDAPHLTAIYRLPERMIEMGAIWTRKALATFVECQQSGVFPGYSDSIIDLEAPRWAEVQFDEDHVAGKYALREA